MQLFFLFSVGKDVAPTDPDPQDINLDSPVYVLWGVRPLNSTPGAIPPHAVANIMDIPAISNSPVNPNTGAVLAIPVSCFDTSIYHLIVAYTYLVFNLFCKLECYMCTS